MQVPISPRPNWQQPAPGDVETPEHYQRRAYEDYISSPQWAAKRAELFRVRGKRCRCCDATEEMQAHHMTYERFGHESLDDLMPLCRFCHEALTAEWKQVREARLKTGSLKDWSERTIDRSRLRQHLDNRHYKGPRKPCIHVTTEEDAEQQRNYVDREAALLRQYLQVGCDSCGSAEGQMCVSKSGRTIVEANGQHKARKG